MKLNPNVLGLSLAVVCLPFLAQASGSAFNFADFSTDKSVVWTMTFTAETNDNGRMRFDSLVMNGSAVSEPGTYALLTGFAYRFCLQVLLAWSS